MANTVALKLTSDRRRMARSLYNLLQIIARSDAKLYARNVPFTPIMPTSNAPLQAALTLVVNQILSIPDIGNF